MYMEVTAFVHPYIRMYTNIVKPVVLPAQLTHIIWASLFHALLIASNLTLGMISIDCNFNHVHCTTLSQRYATLQQSYIVLHYKRRSLSLRVRASAPTTVTCVAQRSL